MPMLGVNVDHVATVRQARRTIEPNPVAAAVLAELAGADCITIHLREDRRHIQDADVFAIKQAITIKLNLEMAAAEEIVRIALKLKPEQVTLVPERRQEVTTEGGLDVAKGRRKLAGVIKRFRRAGITVSLFIDPEEAQIRASREVGADAIELHTGAYANAKTESKAKRELTKITRAAEFAQGLGLIVNAGHGLTYRNVQPIAAIPGIHELHIGHTIVSRAVVGGITEAVSVMKNLVKEAK